MRRSTPRPSRPETVRCVAVDQDGNRCRGRSRDTYFCLCPRHRDGLAGLMIDAANLPLKALAQVPWRHASESSALLRAWREWWRELFAFAYDRCSGCRRDWSLPAVALSHADDSVGLLYRCRRCGHTWTTSWRLEALADYVDGNRRSGFCGLSEASR
jgi:hypothetical protein